MGNNVIDFKTRKPLFNQGFRSRLGDAVAPHVESRDLADGVVTAIETAVCVELVCLARDFACKAASKFSDRVFNPD